MGVCDGVKCAGAPRSCGRESEVCNELEMLVGVCARKAPRGRRRECRVSVGLPEASRFAAIGEAVTPALPPASRPALSQTPPGVPNSTPAPANGGCTPRLKPASAIQPSASGWGTVRRGIPSWLQFVDWSGNSTPYFNQAQNLKVYLQPLSSSGIYYPTNTISLTSPCGSPATGLIMNPYSAAVYSPLTSPLSTGYTQSVSWSWIPVLCP